MFSVSQFENWRRGRESSDWNLYSTEKFTRSDKVKKKKHLKRNICVLNASLLGLQSKSEDTCGLRSSGRRPRVFRCHVTIKICRSNASVKDATFSVTECRG